jgi:hypothetical protein
MRCKRHKGMHANYVMQETGGDRVTPMARGTERSNERSGNERSGGPFIHQIGFSFK